jgi:hypothetical protein
VAFFLNHEHHFPRFGDRTGTHDGRAEVLGAIDPPTDHQPHRPRRPAAAPGRDLRPLHIGGVEIAQDEHGRYSLNDMHRAAGGDKRHQPSDFLRSESVRAFIAKLDQTPGICGVSAVASATGRNGGTFGARLVVLRYAAWIAPTRAGHAPAFFAPEQAVFRVSQSFHNPFHTHSTSDCGQI